MGKHRQQRTALTIQLLPGQDDDLIHWLLSLPAGSRNAAGKAVLRAGLELPAPAAPAAPAPAVIGSSELDNLRAALEQQQQQQARLLNMVQQLAQQIAAGVTPVAPQPDAPTIEAQSRLTPEKLQERTARMKQSAKW